METKTMPSIMYYIKLPNKKYDILIEAYTTFYVFVKYNY